MKSICDFFGVKDTTGLTWAHGVNSQQYLAECCADDGLMMLEGDVQFEPAMDGTDADEAVPFMALDEQDIANLTFEGWLTAANEFNKGVKVDIRTPHAVEPVLEVMNELAVKTPVIIHAEIFNLLNAEDAREQFEPEKFIRRCQQMAPTATISLGWSLKRTADEDGRMEDILIGQVTELMFSRLGGLNYTIEIRGGYTPNWERGAALIFEPIAKKPRPNYAGNVVDGTDIFRAGSQFPRNGTDD